MIIWILSNTMEYDSSWYRPAEFILLIVSSILQIICISAPWWHIATHKERISTMIGPDGVLLNSTVPEERLYHGVFYGIKCNASSCKTMTIREYHLQETGKQTLELTGSASRTDLSQLINGVWEIQYKYNTNLYFSQSTYMAT